MELFIFSESLMTFYSKILLQDAIYGNMKSHVRWAGKLIP
jgi:hypothetical protein